MFGKKQVVYHVRHCASTWHPNPLAFSKNSL